MATMPMYHREMREILERLGLNLTLSEGFEVLFDNPEVDFVFPLLNRAGFLNSEMLCPLLCERLGLPYLGATPIVRGLADDKHLAKRAAQAAGVATAPWAIFRRGAEVDLARVPQSDRFVIKPNASSASWGVKDATDLSEIEAAVAGIHAMGHDALVEPFVPGCDLEVPVLTIGGEPRIMPMIIVRQNDQAHLRTYEEKRAFVEHTAKYSLDALEDADITARAGELAGKLWKEYQPFDYGRFEFRVDERTGDITFLEVNLNCNLSSQKTFGCSAALAGWSQEQLVETVLAESLGRQGLLGVADRITGTAVR